MFLYVAVFFSISIRKSILRVEELVSAMRKFGKVSDELKLKRIVEVLDEDKDGVINIEDAIKVLSDSCL